MQEFSDSQKTYTPSENTEHDVSSCATMARVRKRLLPRVYIFFLFCKKYVYFRYCFLKSRQDSAVFLDEFPLGGSIFSISVFLGY